MSLALRICGVFTALFAAGVATCCGFRIYNAVTTIAPPLLAWTAALIQALHAVGAIILGYLALRHGFKDPDD